MLIEACPPKIKSSSLLWHRKITKLFELEHTLLLSYIRLNYLNIINNKAPGLQARVKSNDTWLKESVGKH